MFLAPLIIRKLALRSFAAAIGRIGLRRFIPGFVIKSGGAIARFLVGAAGFVLAGALSWLGDRLFSEVFSQIQEVTYNIAFFDWNQSDTTIRAQIQQNNNQIAQLLGRFAGSGLVRLAAVGAAFGAKLYYPVVAGRVALDLAEDTSGQLRGEFTSMVSGIRQILSENAILSMILTFRQRRWFGLEPRPEDGPYNSFASQIEKRVESITNPALRNFVQGLLEGAEDAFWDVGYIIAGTLDDIVAANRFRNQKALGPERVVKVVPDSSAPEEAIVLAGPQQVVQQQIDQTIATHRMVWNRDLGQIVGIPVEDFPRARHQTRKLVVVFKDKAEPPYRTSEGRSREVHYSVPDAKRGLTWAELKLASKRFTWGPFRATAVLNNNRQMAVYGVSPAEAEAQLRSLLQLSTAELVTLSVSEEKIRSPAQVKRPRLMYPAYATLVTAPNDFQGRPIGGTTAYRRERRRIPLWTEQEPDDLGPLG